MVGSGDNPPQGSVSFNGQLVLIRELPPRTVAFNNPIVAGPKMVSKVGQATSSNQGALPPLASDPWAGQSLGMPPVATAPRSLSGPTTDKLAEQDAKLQSMEQAIQDLKDTQSKQNKNFDQLQQDVQRNERKMMGHVDTSIKQLKSELDQSFTSALAQQSSSFDKNMQELKQLLLMSQKRKQPDDGDQDMNHWMAVHDGVVLGLFCAGLLRHLLLGFDHVWDTCLFRLFQFVDFAWILLTFHGSVFAPWIIKLFSRSVCWRPCLGAAIRYGEAKNPGPAEFVEFGLCITNPTTLNLKADLYGDLFNAASCQLVSCSETSATAKMQSQFVSAMRPKGIRCQWSPPVQPMRVKVSGEQSERGQASGVALLGRVPFRSARIPLRSEWATSTRVLHSVVRLGPCDIQVFAVYFRPCNNSASMPFNNDMMRMILDHSRLLPLPLIVMGDFNCQPSDLDCWPELQAQGFAQLSDLHAHLHGLPFPPACKGATSPDTAILSPILKQYVSSVKVMDSSWMATHSPVVFRLRIPAAGLFHLRYKFPKSFVDFGLENVDLANAAPLVDVSEVDSLEGWGKAVEPTVDQALRQSHPAVSSLPRSYRGRCVPLQPKKFPIQSSVRVASHGDYEPPGEVVTMPTRRKVKQLRRIDSLKQRMISFEKRGAKYPGVKDQLVDEWQAIVHCFAFGMPFLSWVQDFGVVGFPACPFPSSEWLGCVSQLVKFHVDAAVHADLKIRRDKVQYQIHQDTKSSRKSAFAKVRGPGNPPITELRSAVDFDAFIVGANGPCLYEVYGDSSSLESLDVGFPVQVGDCMTSLQSKSAHHVTVKSFQALQCDGSSVQVTQEQRHCDPKAIAHDLNSFWVPIWTRDPLDLRFLDDQVPSAKFPSLISAARHPEIQVNMLDLNVWKLVIKKLKPNSARGVDSISAQELQMLPDNLIQLLAEILASMVDGFPEDLMVGLTCPLAKTSEVPLRHQTRPITVLALTYRVWAMVACWQISRVFSEIIPHDVTGLLPKRGSFDTAYLTQFQIERARYESTPLSGVTLDLQKCFNKMRWSFVHALLWLLGISRSLLRKWLLSVSAIQRVWLICGQVCPASGCTTGFPEGDVWSVMAMIAVASFWTTQTRNHFQVQGHPAADLLLSAYADNWAWMVSLPGQHLAVWQSTVTFLDEAGLELDTSKTWCWATCPDHAGLVQLAASELLDGVIIPLKTCNADLGFQLQYSGRFRKGINDERTHKGIQRLLRLQSIPYDIHTKAQIVRMSVFPATLYGAAIRPPAADTLDRLRNFTARAVLGPSQSMSSAIALICFHKGILDPEHWMIAQILRIARAFLLAAPLDVRRAFLHIASRFQGTLHCVRGPASALSFCLQQIGWQIDREGVISVNAFLRFDLCANSFQRFRRFLDVSWQKGLIMALTFRKSWYHFPDIAIAPTVAVLKKFNPSQQRRLIRENSGSYQCHVQKSKWIANDDGLCPLCGVAEDSRSHRLLECAIGQDTREPFSGLVQWLQDTGSEFAQFPFVTVHPDHEALICAAFSLTVPSFDDVILDFISQRVAQGVNIHWFTDGSCMAQSDPSSRFSAFAIAVDLCCDDMDRKAQAAKATATSVAPASLQQVMSCRTPGEQDILRAEIFAAATVLLNAKVGVVHVDNQTAITLLNLALSAKSITELAARDHFDILREVWNHRTHIAATIVKVDSHVDIAARPSLLEQYMCWGNHFVDEQAKTACRDLMPELVSKQRALQHDMEEQICMLTKAYQLQLELHVVRAKAIQAKEDNPVTASSTAMEIMTAFKTWTATPGRSLSGDFDLQFLDFSMFGRSLMESFLCWVQCLKWRSDGNLDGPMHLQCGTSWIELAVSWMLHARTYVPVLRENSDKQRLLVHARNYEEAKEIGVGLSESGTSLQKMWDNLFALLPHVLAIPGKRKKVASIYNLGGSRYVQGFDICFEMPFQAETIEILRNVIISGSCILSATVHIDTDGVKQEYLEPYDRLLKTCSSGQYHVRKARRPDLLGGHWFCFTIRLGSSAGTCCFHLAGRLAGWEQCPQSRE